MGIKRIVDTAFWTDGKVDEFSPEDKYFMLYLLTNPFSKQLGIYEISLKQAAFQMGYSVDAFKVLLERFETKYRMIRYSKETNEIAILNFLRHSVVKGGKPVEDCIKKEMTLVKNRKLIDAVFSRLYGRDDLNETVKKIIDEYAEQYGIDNDNDNDNDNENERTGNVSLHDSCHDSFDGMILGQDEPEKPENKRKRSKKPEPVKHKHGEFDNVLLSDDELKKLQDRFPDWKERIENLSYYLKSKGAKYTSHYATILSWARRDDAKDGKRNGAGNEQAGKYDQLIKAGKLGEWI